MAEYHDPDRLALLQRAFNAAAQQVIGAKILGSSVGVYAVMASALMEAAKNGEKDFDRLKAAALAAIS